MPLDFEPTGEIPPTTTNTDDATAKTLSTMIGTAVIDANFRQTLLSDPWSALNAFDLSREEKEAIAGIEANSIEQFALQLARWIAKTDGDETCG
jgi:hypothetical protein